MGDYTMTVRFERAAERRLCLVTAWARDRRPFQISTMAASEGLPHDLSTFAVEQALGIAGGFFNLTAHRATFRSSGLRPTKPGRAVIVAHRSDLDDAERVVQSAEAAWLAGRPTPAAAALDTVDRLWRDLPPGGHVDLVWHRLPLTTAVSTAGRRTRMTRRAGWGLGRS